MLKSVKKTSSFQLFLPKKSVNISSLSLSLNPSSPPAPHTHTHTHARPRAWMVLALLIAASLNSYNIQKVQITKFLVMEFSPASCHFLIMRYKYPSQQPVAKHPTEVEVILRLTVSQRPDITSCRNDAVLFLWGPLSDERSGLQFAV
jgi:hypothetical protein